MNWRFWGFRVQKLAWKFILRKLSRLDWEQMKGEEVMLSNEKINQVDSFTYPDGIMIKMMHVVKIKNLTLRLHLN